MRVLFFVILLGFRVGAQQSAETLLDNARKALAAGSYPLAIESAGQAADIFHKRGDTANEAIAANTIGSAELYRGEYSAALTAFRRALALDRAQHDGKGEITRLSNIGNVYFFQGRYLDALQSYEDGLRRVEETRSEAWNAGRRQLVLTNLAILYEQLGQNEKALEYYQQAKQGGASLPPDEYAQLLSNAGTLYRRLGDPVLALENYRTAQELFAREHLSDGEIHVLQNIGIAYALDLRDMDQALAAFGQALKLAEGTQNRRETVLAHLFRGEAFYRMGRDDDAGHDFAAAQAGAAEIGATEEGWTAQFGLGRVLRRRGDVAAARVAFEKALGTIESVRAALGTSSLKAEFLANKRDVYDAIIDLQLESGAADTRQLFNLMERARSRNLQDALRARMKLPDLAGVQGRLGPRDLLIEYWSGADRMAALWVTKAASGVVQRIAKERPLDGIPLDQRFSDLLIVPDGATKLVAFEALGTPMVVERFAVSYLPSAALIEDSPRAGTPAPPWSRQLVAFGDPLPPGTGSLPADRGWARLPDAAREVRAIVSEVRGRAETHVAADDRKAMLARAPGVPLIHFATHAAVDPMDVNRSRILFTAERGDAGSAYLFWPEAAALKLDGVDLVTLSACDTEGGRMVRGEGVQSFSRAFLAAGARSTVTTLWRVADRPTAEFMKRFYAHLAKGESKAQALRAAKLSFLKSGGELANPVYWAAFVLNGDGRAPVPGVVSWWWVAAAGVIVVFGCVVVWRRR